MLKPAASLLVAIALLTLCSLAQAPNLSPADGEERPAVPTVTFTLDWPGADPEHYVLAIDSSGRAAYESAGGKRFTLGDPYSSKFTVTEATRDRIFNTARTLNYFHRDFEYRKGKVAFTGKKTIAYADASRQFEASYNWTDNHALRQLTELMQAVAATVEFGRSLDYLHRHERLGLNAELKRMDELAASGQLAELQVLGPQLEQIAGDSSVMEIARQKARKLLQRASAGNRAPATPATAQK